MSEYKQYYIDSVAKELESRGWRPDSRGEPECCDETSAAGADIIVSLGKRIIELESALKAKDKDIQIKDGMLKLEIIAHREQLAELAEECLPYIQAKYTTLQEFHELRDKLKLLVNK